MQTATVGKPTFALGPFLLTVLAILASLAAAGSIASATTDPSRVAIVFPPWWTASRAIAAAAPVGEILGVGGVPFVVIVHRGLSTGGRQARPVGALFFLGADPRSLCSSLLLDPKS